MAEQYKINFKKVHTVTVNNYQRVPDESKDEILKARFEPAVAESIRAFCRGRKITTTDFLREYATLGDTYFDYIEMLRKPEVIKVIVPLLDQLSKKI